MAISQTYTTTGQHTYTIPVSGVYKIQCYGAGGGGATGQSPTSNFGNVRYGGGAGGYTEYYKECVENEILYCYVGGTGTTSAGGINGGGAPSQGATRKHSNTGIQYTLAYGGGGATHVATIAGTLKSLGSKTNVICVAGGGGGSGGSGGPENDFNAVDVIAGLGGAGGGSTGGKNIHDGGYGTKYISNGGSQTEAGGYNNTVKGGFGYGGVAKGFPLNKTFYAVSEYSSSDYDYSATNCGGGGAGLYGGGGGNGYNYSYAGSGGSGYIKSATTTDSLGNVYTNKTTQGSGSAANKNGKIIITLFTTLDPQPPSAVNINSLANNRILLKWSGHLYGVNNTLIDHFKITLEASYDNDFSTIAATYSYETSEETYDLRLNTSLKQYNYLRYKVQVYGTDGKISEYSNYSNICELTCIVNPMMNVTDFNKAVALLQSWNIYLFEEETLDIITPIVYNKIKYTDLTSLITAINQCMNTNIVFNTTKPLDIDWQALLYYL